MHLLFKLFIILLLLPFSGISQTLQWEKTIGGNDIDELRHILEFSNGNYMLSGYSASNISGDKTENANGEEDFWLVETMPNAAIVWQKTFGGSGSDLLVKTLETNDGGILLAGISSSGISGDKTDVLRGEVDIWIVKLNTEREIVWQQTIGGNGEDDLADIYQTIDGGYILGATSSSGIFGEKTQASRGGKDLWILKLNSQGEIEWQHTYGGNNDDVLQKIIPTQDGGYIVGATSLSGNSGEKTEPSRGFSDYWVLKLNMFGSIVWQKTLGGDKADNLSSLIPTLNGYLVGGNSASEISGDKTQPLKGLVDLWIFNLDASGNFIWQKNIGGNNVESIRQISPAGDGGFLLGATSSSEISGDKSGENRGGEDFWLVKITALGDICWDQTLGGDVQDQLMDIIIDRNGDVIAGGGSNSGATGDKGEDLIGIRDFWVTKTTQPQFDMPIAFELAEITACDPNRDGFADSFDTSLVEETVVGDQTNVVVRYFNQNGIELESPLPNPFTNTVQNLQIITVRVEDSANPCAFAETNLQIRISPCEEPKPVRVPLNLPGFFTPNGDGQNDIWIPVTTVQLKQIHIFDRYGKLLKELNPNGRGWDGTFLGSPMPSDDYWYRVITVDDWIQTGHFSLVRGTY